MTTREDRRQQRLRQNAYDNPISLGCGACHERSMCGGLSVAEKVFDCSAFCCGKPQTCDRVCVHNPDFSERKWEVNGFDLGNVPRTRATPVPDLPSLFFLFQHRGRRLRPFGSGMAMSLYEMFERGTPNLKFSGRRALEDAYLMAPEAPFVLTGAGIDKPLERWWQMGERNRRRGAEALWSIGPSLVTTPNYSLFSDRPRTDDLHAIKRIATVWEEFASAGLSTALHVNARTEHDYDRWGDFIGERPEVTHIASEFATCGLKRTEWHIEQLGLLAEKVGRPLGFVVRGGTTNLPSLMAIFARVHLLETSIFMKSMNRQVAREGNDGRVAWGPMRTRRNEYLDDLFEANAAVIARVNSGSRL
ncbi:MAG: DUF4417 domain-containing protein [Hyphomonadaceae bacterium]